MITCLFMIVTVSFVLCKTLLFVLFCKSFSLNVLRRHKKKVINHYKPQLSSCLKLQSLTSYLLFKFSIPKTSDSGMSREPIRLHLHKRTHRMSHLVQTQHPSRYKYVGYNRFGSPRVLIKQYS